MPGFLREKISHLEQERIFLIQKTALLLDLRDKSFLPSGSALLKERALSLSLAEPGQSTEEIEANIEKGYQELRKSLARIHFDIELLKLACVLYSPN